MPIFFTASTSGDCTNTNSGQIDIFSIYSTNPFPPPYLQPPPGTGVTLQVEWLIPALGIDTGISTGFTSTRSGLSAGTYTISITANTLPPVIVGGTFYVSDGCCTSGLQVQNTTCGLNNGALTAYSQTICVESTYNLYQSGGTLISTTTSLVGFETWSNLSPGVYYVEILDCGGCSAQTQMCVIEDSNPVNFNLFVVDNPNCSGPAGKIFITELVGQPPFSYLWTTGDITSSISGLTSGTYGVTVTDATGCITSKSATVNDVDIIGFGSFTSIPPSCFSSDGSITINITGGTGPYYYSGSNGATFVTFAQSYTFTGLGVGGFAVEVTDAAFCNINASTSLSIPNSIGSVSLSTTNSSCSFDSGTITINITGTNNPYTYTIIDSFGNIISETLNSTSYTFFNVSSGTYTVLVDNGGSCMFMDVVTITNTNAFEISASTTGTTCGLNNGSVLLQTDVLDSYTYFIPSLGLSTPSTTATTFSNLPAGSYSAQITNSTGCTREIDFVITQSSAVNFILNKTNCLIGNDGTITALISGGQAPFNLNWSSNVNGQTGIYVTGLTAGTYTVTVVDALGCTKTRSIEITCNENLVTYQLFKFCEGTFIETPASKLGLTQMLNEGFKDLTSGETGCVLVSADYILKVQIGTAQTTSNFYTSTSLTDVPSDELYVNTLNSLLSGYTGIGLIDINSETNTIKLNTDCSYILADKNVLIDVQIIYNILCQSESINICAIFSNISFPIPFSLNFIPSGTTNGKTSYYSNVTDFGLTGSGYLFIYWDGTQWVMDIVEIGELDEQLAFLTGDTITPIGLWEANEDDSIETIESSCFGICLNVDDGMFVNQQNMPQMNIDVDGKLTYFNFNGYYIKYNSGSTQWELYDDGIFTPSNLVGTLSGDTQYPVGTFISLDSNNYETTLGSCPLPIL